MNIHAIHVGQAALTVGRRALVMGGRASDGIKFIQAAGERWRHGNGLHLAALVRAGAKFENGVLIERPDEAEMKDAVRSTR